MSSDSAALVPDRLRERLTAPILRTGLRIALKPMLSPARTDRMAAPLLEALAWWMRGRSAAKVEPTTAGRRPRRMGARNGYNTRRHLRHSLSPRRRILYRVTCDPQGVDRGTGKRHWPAGIRRGLSTRAGAPVSGGAGGCGGGVRRAGRKRTGCHRRRFGRSRTFAGNRAIAARARHQTARCAGAVLAVDRSRRVVGARKPCCERPCSQRAMARVRSPELPGRQRRNRAAGLAHPRRSADAATDADPGRQR